MEQAAVTTTRARRSRLLLRGESAVASVGVALAVILVVGVAASAWWVHRTQSAAAAVAHARHVRAAGELVAGNVESLLAAGELSAARRMLAEAGAAHHFAHCRLVLADGRVIASAEPWQITVQKLPDRWPDTRRLHDDDGGTAAAADPHAQGTPDGSLTLTLPVSVPGRGEATLEVVAAPADAAAAKRDAWAGVGAIGVAALIAFLLTYRTMRARVRAAAAIREALLALEEGETSTTSLCVAEHLGGEARLWNNLMAERERLRKQGMAERTRETLGSRDQAKGDLTAACDAMSQGLVLVDERNRVTYANGAAAVFLRAKREELVGGEIGRFLQVGPVLESVQETVTGTGGRRRYVHDVEGKDDTGAGAGVLRFSVRPVRREDNASAMLTIEDITQQKVAEAARHSFVAQATHELRTPLTNIRLYVETAIDEGEQDPATRSKCLNVINGETRRLERIVGEMLSVAEIEAGSFKINSDDVRLETVFEDLRHDYAEQAKDKQITLAFNLPPKLPQVKGDRDKMLMALHNLVGNALKYTPAGGSVTVTVSAAGKNLVVEVQDSGIGIGPEDAERIFERFYRAKDPRVSKITGTGLGLTLAREVVRLHGGDIGVDSQLNQGSTFTLSLPVIAEAA
jgi:PAS domain S-box-containing protein